MTIETYITLCVCLFVSYSGGDGKDKRKDKQARALITSGGQKSDGKMDVE